jgi:hypothetical protein
MTTKQEESEMRAYQIGTEVESFGNTATPEEAERCAAIIAAHARAIIAERGWDIQVTIGHEDRWDRHDEEMESLNEIIQRQWIEWVSLKKYRVEHMQGTAGINESAIETVEIEASTASAAIELVTNNRAGAGWHWDGDALMSDAASNKSGSYCDYWMAEEIADEAVAE